MRKTAQEILDELRTYLREQARLADMSAKEWSAGGAKEQAAYRNGMWYAYHDVENVIGPIPI